MKRMPVLAGQGARRASLRALLLAFGIWQAPAALAQEVSLPGRYYGTVVLPSHETTGNAAQYIQAQKGAFEPIHELPKKDHWRKLSEPIGRVDILVSSQGRDQLLSCTGALLENDFVLTNNHCIPDGTVKASIVMNYLTLDGSEAERFELNVQPGERHATLDYALLKVGGKPAAKYGSVKLSAGDAEPGQSLVVIHHPAGRPKVMSRFRCLALPEQPRYHILRHLCDTLGGSSGSLLLSPSGGTVALHHSGGLIPDDPKSFNRATRMRNLASQSPIIGQLVKSGAPAPVAAPANVATDDKADRAPRDTAAGGGLTVNEMNSALRGQ